MIVNGTDSMTLQVCLQYYDYRIAGKFYRVQFSWTVDLYHFAGLIFAAMSTHAWALMPIMYYTIKIYFMGLIFAVR